MPGFLNHPINRRAFLRSAAAASIVLGLPGSLTRAQAQNTTFRLALLSDIHIAANPLDAQRNFLPTENLRTVLGQVAAADPEGVIINGDLARTSGEPGDYEAITKLLGSMAGRTPVYFVLGNHDDRANFFKAFEKPAGARQSVQDKLVLVAEHPLVRLILLDSLLYANKTPGLLGKPQRQWLSRFLESCDARPTVLFVHHTLSDGDGDLLDVDRLFDTLRPHRKVQAIFYGHSHAYSYGRHQGIHLVNLPAVGYNFADKEPVGWVEASFARDGVNLTLKAIGGNRAADGETKSLSWDS
jgi:3',5'-cyclic AMP phosphodiesterase CpdA